MTNQEVVLAYIRRFCVGDIDGMEPLIAPDLRFDGTFHQYLSRAAYLDSLRNDPPEKCGYEVISLTEGGDNVAVFYNYKKPDRVIKIAQLFKIKNQKISEVLLVFDGRGIT
jgi:hypothetical protein